MKFWNSLFFLCLLFLCACGSRYIPYEVTTMYETPVAVKPAPKKSATIIVDPGHGGKDFGAMSKKDCYEEKSLTLTTALMVKNYLSQLGYRVILTRAVDDFVALDSRAEIANTSRADLFVSIHYNYSTNPEAQGIEVYYYKENKSPPSKRIVESKSLGKVVLNQLTTETNAPSRGIKQANFAVIRETAMPAILIEAGFLSNVKERERIKDSRYLRTIAQGVAKGVDEYLQAR